MRRFPRIVAVSLLALACAPAAHAAGPALQIAWRPATTANYTPAGRPRSAIRLIVIHVTEGGYLGSVSWLRNPRAKASAHYVVSRTGEIAQLVRNADIAWHAGNWQVNRESIGVEHEGFTYRKGTFTDAEYRASARLTGWLARSYLLPIDRRHFIGHANVPDPNHAGQWGGFAHHMDPGPYWDWKRYLSYVRAYARGGTPPTFHAPAPRPAPVAPRTRPKVIRPGGRVPTIGPLSTFAGLRKGARLTGYVPWRAGVAGSGIRKVEFLVDGALRWTEKRAPFRYGGDDGLLDTTRLANGGHVLAIRVTTTRGRVSGSSLRVSVANTPFQVAAVAPANAQVVSGRTHLVASVAGGDADRVEFVVDGRLHRTERSAPYEDDWDTTREANGAHTLTLRGVAKDGRVATSTLTVVVQNADAPKPAPKPTTSISIRSQSLRDGQTVSGAPRWWADVRGRDVERVEFWIDGVLRWTAGSRGPWSFGGDGGRWDTRAERNGQHVLTVRAVAVGGAEDEATALVTVANQAPPPLAVRAPLPDGSTVTGTVHVVAPVEGSPERVEFWVDGTLRHVERSAPYEFDWDASREKPGTHTLLIRAVSGDRSTSATQTLTVPAPAPPPAPTVTLPLADGQTLAGTVHVVAEATGKPARVEFSVDGRLRHVERSAPYEFDWDTTREADGAHTLQAKAVSDAGSGTASATVTVANRPVEPEPVPQPPTPESPPPPEPSAVPAFAVQSSLADGATVTGTVRIEATVTGEARRVEVWVDGRRRAIDYGAPWAFDWDTTRFADGRHTVVLRARARDGSTVEATAVVVVANGS